MQQTDERILEYLQSELWATSEEMADYPHSGLVPGRFESSAELSRQLSSLRFAVVTGASSS